MKISKGPMLESYAAILDCSLQEVLDHVNAFVNYGSEIEGAAKTEKERFEQIKKSIQERIDNSITAHIKRSLMERKAA